MGCSFGMAGACLGLAAVIPGRHLLSWELQALGQAAGSTASHLGPWMQCSLLSEEEPFQKGEEERNVCYVLLC